ncbi:MAG: dihydroxyacetone kinase subunit DhaL [Bryobacteraceae bacterium]|jgi:dihydroxyacetone kinase phosphoprotein-dependent L subunit
MTTARLNTADLRRALLFVADEIIREEPRLNALDAALGDGDHGITMRLGFEAIKERLGELGSPAGFRELLTEAGKAFMGATGGAIGIILGRMLISAGTGLRDAQELGTPELSRMLALMETAIAQAGKAKPGDKTILDAVHAAHEAAAAAAGQQQDLGEALAQAASAAESAAQHTANLVCRVGRASRLGERTLGHPDPGAISFSIIMRSLQRCAAEL